MFTYLEMIIFIMSIITFVVFAIDKMQAVVGGRRIPEALLLTFSLLGGAFGGLCGMVLCCHKTQHTSFLICVPVFLALQLTAVILLRLYII